MDSIDQLRKFGQLLTLARKRLNSAEEYQIFQEFQGRLLVNYLQKYQIINRSKFVLDLGAGDGGYSLILKELFLDVYVLDLFPKNLDFASVIQANALHIPLASNSFDLVICASLIEHVKDQTLLLKETYRVLRPGGYLYLSFPPFYSLNGGHQFSPYHLLGEKIALRIAINHNRIKGKQWLEEKFPSQPASYEEAFGDWGLYRTTIARMNRYLWQLPYRTIDRSTRWLPFDFSGIPLLGEILTWHVQYLLRKP